MGMTGFVMAVHFGSSVGRYAWVLVLLAYLQRTEPPVVPVLDPRTCAAPEGAVRENEQSVAELFVTFFA